MMFPDHTPNLAAARGALQASLDGYYRSAVIVDIAEKHGGRESIVGYYNRALDHVDTCSEHFAKCTYYLLDYFGETDGIATWDDDFSSIPEIKINDYPDVKKRAILEALQANGGAADDIAIIKFLFTSIFCMGMIVAHYCDVPMNRHYYGEQGLHPFEQACFVSASACARLSLHDNIIVSGSPSTYTPIFEQRMRDAGYKNTSYVPNREFLDRCGKANLEDAAEAYINYRKSVNSIADSFFKNLGLFDG